MIAKVVLQYTILFKPVITGDLFIDIIFMLILIIPIYCKQPKVRPVLFVDFI
mgnify:CR=1 FL=1